jgi:hypothetical protein
MLTLGSLKLYSTLLDNRLEYVFSSETFVSDASNPFRVGVLQLWYQSSRLFPVENLNISN